MDDRELLEAAAKAAGLVGYEHTKCDVGGWEGMAFDLGGSKSDYWNPLTDDADALRLAATLGLTVNFYSGNVYGPDYGINRTHTIDRSNIRRAIVRAAAAMATGS